MSGNPASYALSIDWANAGSFPDNGDSAKLRAYSIKRGRDNTFSGDPRTGEARLARSQVGTLTLTLDNEDGRYDSYNTSSPIYPNVTPGHIVRLQVTDDAANTYTLFTGKVDDIRSQSYRHDARVTLTCSDAWKKMSQRPIAATLTSWTTDPNVQPSVYFPIVEVLGYAGVTTGTNADTGYTFDPGSDGFYVTWTNNDVPFQSLHDLCEMDGGYCWIGVDDKFYFLQRTNAVADTSNFTLDQAEVLNEPQLTQPWDNIVNTVRMNVYDRTRLTDYQVVWCASDIPLLTTGAKIHYTMEYKGSTNQVAPCGDDANTGISELYVRLNTAEDGTGVFLPLAVTQVYPPGSYRATAAVNMHGGGATRAEYDFQNLSTTASGYLLAVIPGEPQFYPDYVTSITAMRAPYDCFDPTETLSEDTTSAGVYGLRELRLNYEYMQSTAKAKTITSYYLARFKDPKPIITVEIVNRATIQFKWDLYTLLNFTSTYLFKPAGTLAYSFRIISISHETGVTPYEVKTTWVLEPVANASGL